MKGQNLLGIIGTTDGKTETKLFSLTSVAAAANDAAAQTIVVFFQTLVKRERFPIRPPKPWQGIHRLQCSTWSNIETSVSIDWSVDRSGQAKHQQ